MNKNNKNLASKPAYSLVFAFLVMTVIMIVAGTTIENTQNKVRYFNELEGTSQARLAAESAAEEAVQEIRNERFGYEPTANTEAFCLDGDGDSHCTGAVGDAYGGYTVYATATENDEDGDGYYYIPIPGTGTAGSDDDCSLLNDHESIDHPCNWNKWMYGETVVLPLYSVDESGNFVSPYDADIQDWVLKVRTPCTDGSYTAGCDRYTFGATAADITTDPSLILWQVTGENGDGTIALYPNDALQSGFGAGSETRRSDNTEIPASLIDTGVGDSSYEVFSLDLTAAFAALEDTDIEYYFLGDTDVTSLEMQLDMITTLVSIDGTTTIPYLEWQLYTYGSIYQLISPVTAVKGEGYYEGKEGTYYFPYVITRSSTGESSSIYTLSN